MASILKVRDADGTVHEIYSIQGKSAYQYAQEGGYTGTEAEFAEKLASGALIVTITESNGTLSANKTFSEIVDAIYAGTTVLASYNYMILTLIGITGYAMYFGIIHCDNDGTDAMAATVVIEIADNDGVNDISADVEIPKTLPNPNALTFTGAVNGSYDGSEALTVEIPSKLGQFENDVGYLTLGTLPIYDGSVINGGEIV